MTLRRKSPMSPRRVPLSAGSGGLARSPMKKKPRPAKTTLRIYGTPEHREWMKEQPCLICGRTPSDSAHLKNGGTGRKADAALCVPLCATIVAVGYSGHHDEFDAGKRSFRAKYPEFDAACAKWQAHLAGAAA